METCTDLGHLSHLWSLVPYKYLLIPPASFFWACYSRMTHSSKWCVHLAHPMGRLGWVNHEQWWMRAWQQDKDKKGKMMLGRACSFPFSFHVLHVWRKKVILCFSRKNVLRERLNFSPFYSEITVQKKRGQSIVQAAPAVSPVWWRAKQ